MSSNQDKYDLTKAQDRDDRRKHVELVSAIVGRMAGASAAAKGWSITLAGAAFGVALVRDKWYLIVLGIVALIFFGFLDGQYLHNEKRFRDLYDAVVIDNSVRPLSMDVTRLKTRSKRASFVSWSILGFYGPLIGGGLVLLTAALCHSNSTSEGTSPTPQPTPTVTTSTTTVTVEKSPTSAAPPTSPAAPSATTTTIPRQTP